jgi:hypothetical protein
MPTETLTGFAIRIVALPFWDHTYVTSSLGHIWACWGRSAAGTQICTGVGNVDQAYCLSQPNSEAGITYGLTGVCHQTANRILYPSGQTVSGARGYRASVYFWGAYGKDSVTGLHYSPGSFPWPELLYCQQNHIHPEPGG